MTIGKRKGDKETWWWNEEVQKSIKEKKEAKKTWDEIKNENIKKVYKEKKSKAKKAVAMAKGRAYDDLYARLETKEGEKELYRVPIKPLSFLEYISKKLYDSMLNHVLRVFRLVKKIIRKCFQNKRLILKVKFTIETYE